MSLWLTLFNSQKATMWSTHNLVTSWRRPWLPMMTREKDVYYESVTFIQLFFIFISFIIVNLDDLTFLQQQYIGYFISFNKKKLKWKFCYCCCYNTPLPYVFPSPIINVFQSSLAARIIYQLVFLSATFNSIRIMDKNIWLMLFN